LFIKRREDAFHINTGNAGRAVGECSCGDKHGYGNAKGDRGVSHGSCHETETVGVFMSG
jgi:hypothetical protein